LLSALHILPEVGRSVLENHNEVIDANDGNKYFFLCEFIGTKLLGSVMAVLWNFEPRGGVGEIFFPRTWLPRGF